MMKMSGRAKTFLDALGILSLICIASVTLGLFLAGCASPRVGSTSWTKDELDQRTEAAYGPEVERAEWGVP